MVQPYFYSFQEFLTMGEHGIYVWSSWAITVLVMLGFILYSISQRRRLITDLKTQHARQQQRKQGNKSQ